MTLSQYDLVIGAYHQSRNHWTLLVNHYCVVPFNSPWLHYTVHQARSFFNNIYRSKGESATFVDQLAKTGRMWFIKT